MSLSLCVCKCAFANVYLACQIRRITAKGAICRTARARASARITSARTAGAPPSAPPADRGAIAKTSSAARLSWTLPACSADARALAVLALPLDYAVLTEMLLRLLCWQMLVPHSPCRCSSGGYARTCCRPAAAGPASASVCLSPPPPPPTSPDGASLKPDESEGCSPVSGVGPVRQPS